MKKILFILLFPLLSLANPCKFIAEDTGHKWELINGNWFVTATLESFGGQANNTSFDNANALNAAFVASQNNTIDILQVQSNAVYNYDTMMDYVGTYFDSFEITTTGNDRATFFSDNLSTLGRIRTSFDAFKIEKIKFELTTTAPAPNFTNSACFIVNEGTLRNLTIENCEFTAPASESNGFKINLTNNGATLDGLVIKDNYFHNIGMMGLEVVYHTYVAGGEYELAGYFNVDAHGNRIENVGQLMFGMGFSFSGPGQFINVYDNDFLNCVTTAVECIGCIDGDVYNNRFEGNGDIIHFARGSGRLNIRVKSHDNTSVGLLNGRYVFISGRDIESYNNTFNMTSGHSFRGIENMIINNDVIITTGPQALTVVSDLPNRLTNLEIHNSTITGTGNIILAGTNEGAVDIAVYCSDFYKTGGSSYLAVGGTANGTPTVDYFNTNLYQDGVLSSTQNPSGASNCLALPTAPALGGAKTSFYLGFFN